MPQSRGVSGLDASVRQSPVNSLGDGGPQDAVSNESSGVSSQGGSILFDPKSLTADDEFSFETHEEIKRYFEENFHTSLDKDERKRMHTENPALHTTAMKVPKVNQFVLDHLGQRFPYACDNE